MGKEEEEGEKSPVKTGSAATSATWGFGDREVFLQAEPGLKLRGIGGGAEPWHAQCMPPAGRWARPPCHRPGFLLPAGPSNFSDG